MNTPDELDALLAPPQVPADSQLRQRLRDETARRLRPRRTLQVAIIAAALGGCYAAGAGTVWALRSTPAPAVVEAPRNDMPVWRELEQSPQQIELAAEQSDGIDSAKLYLAAARKFARERGDWTAALRCYRNALDMSPEAETMVDPDNDDWLMTALKLSRREEIANEND
jgi:hypothetical protein